MRIRLVVAIALVVSTPVLAGCSRTIGGKKIKGGTVRRQIDCNASVVIYQSKSNGYIWGVPLNKTSLNKSKVC